MASPIQNSDQGGKRQGQKFKSLLVWQYLLKYTDEDHAASSAAIKEHYRRITRNSTRKYEKDLRHNEPPKMIPYNSPSQAR